MKMKPIVLKFDEYEYQKFVRELEKEKTKAQKLVDEVNAINALEVDSSLFDSLIQGNGEATARAVGQAVKDDLARAKIKSQSILKAAIKGDLEKFYKVFNEYRQPDGKFTKCLTFESGKVDILPDSLTNAKEGYKWQIETEEGKALYEAQKRAIEALNNFWKLVRNDSVQFKADKTGSLFSIDESKNKVCFPDYWDWNRPDYDVLARPSTDEEKKLFKEMH